jgi:hypothetical protein
VPKRFFTHPCTVCILSKLRHEVRRSRRWTCTAQRTSGIGRVEQVPPRSMEDYYSNPCMLEIINLIDYYRAVGSGAIIGHSSVISMIHLNVLLYTAPL